MLSLFLISILHSTSIDFRYDEVWAEIRRQQVKYFVIKFLTWKISNKILQLCKNILPFHYFIIVIICRFLLDMITFTAGWFIISWVSVLPIIPIFSTMSIIAFPFVGTSSLLFRFQWSFLQFFLWTSGFYALSASKINW